MRRSKSSVFLERKMLQSQLAYQARKRDNALFQRCVRCPSTVEDGYACCQDCRDKMTAGKRAALEQGMCIDCWTAPASPGKRRCATHDGLRQRDRSTTYTERLGRRRCVRCGKARAQDGLTVCRKCAARLRNYRQRYAARDLKIRETEIRGAGSED